MIRLNVFIQVSAENRAAVLESAKELVAYSLKDNGCIAYDVFESATRSDVLMICETWKDAESLSAHEKAYYPCSLRCLFCSRQSPFGHCGALCADWFIDISDSYS